MKNKLTVNRLALGNLKARKKQYTIMIIGIILAMIFSSSVVLFSFSAVETSRENNRNKYGMQCGIVTSELTDKDFDKAVADGYITDYCYMYDIGFAYPEEGEEYLGAPVAWLDDKAWDMYHLKILDGVYPTAENEIAVEDSQLKFLGYRDAKIGDKISLNLIVQNSDKVVSKEYKLVGIISDRRPNIVDETIFENGERLYDKKIPAIYVAKNTKVEAGGKEDKQALYITDYSKRFEDQDEYSAPAAYLESLSGNTATIRNTGYNYFISNDASLDALFSGGDYLGIVIAALVFASCVAIINAFNSNLKERKKQIGLLRAVGTTGRQIINIYGREAFIISLIATPVSVAVSYLIVKAVLKILSEDAIMAKSLWALLASAVVNVIVVMLASLVPLVIASRITPMQAIRNINVTRKAYKKKIKSKKQFNAPSHLASRNTKFYKGSTIAVSIMLICTICFSCFAFSFVSYSMDHIYSRPFDYIVEAVTVEENVRYGISEIDKQAIESKPYVEKVYGEKQIKCKIECDELDDFARTMDYMYYENSPKHDWFEPKSIEQFQEWMQYSPDDSYYDTKSALKINKEMIDSRLFAYHDDVIRNIEKYVVDGSIDYEKLASGEEVILVVPQKAQLVALIGRNSFGSQLVCDENVGKKIPGYEEVIQAEGSYKAGDELTFSAYAEGYDENDKHIYELYSRNTVKVGAIIRPDSLSYEKTGVGVNTISIITDLSGMNKLAKGLNYSSVNFNSLIDIDDDTDAKIKDEMSVYSEKYNGFAVSKYEDEHYSIAANQRMLTAIVSLIIIGFVICISIVNNSITAHIRENKRVIGTLRAVGADAGDLVKSYVLQMLTMFSWGTGIGFLIYIVIFSYCKIRESVVYDYRSELLFNPWVTVIMTAVSFAVCAINVYVKIKKEMKNSIVENIREL